MQLFYLVAATCCQWLAFGIRKDNKI